MQDEDEVIAEARNCLLTHFSSKSTNQTAILVGLAVAFFADIQAYDALHFPLNCERITFLTVSLGIIIFFVTYAIRRLIYWGQMASAVIRVEAKNEDDDFKKWMESQKLKSKPQLNVAPTYLARLVYPTWVYAEAGIKEDTSLISQVFRFINSKRFKTVYFILVVVVYILALVFSKAILCT